MDTNNNNNESEVLAETDLTEEQEAQAQLDEAKAKKAELEATKEIDEIIEELNFMDKDFDELLSETGNAVAFVKSFDDQVRFVNELNTWAYWANQKWNLNDDSEIQRKYKVVVDTVKQYRDDLEALNLLIPAVDKKDESALAAKQRIGKSLIQSNMKRVRSWITQSNQKTSKDRSISIAATLDGIPVKYSEFDKKGQFFGVANGVIDLRDGSLIKDKPEYMLLKSSEIEYEEEADCPVWRKVILEIMDGDESKVDLLQQIAGSCMVGNSKEKMFFFNGEGSNGKSTFVQTIEKIVGVAKHGGYKAMANPDMITGASNSEKSYALAELKGVRMICMNELGSSDNNRNDNLLDHTIVKRMVDSDEGLNARPIRGIPFEYSCVATMIVNTNNIPSVSTVEWAIWRRLIMIHFNRMFSEAEKDRDLVDGKLQAELSGILNWCIEGAVKYFANGEKFDIPEVVQADTDDWRASEDKLGGFLDANVMEDSKSTIKLTEFLEIYTDWCTRRGMYAGGEKELKKQLIQRKYEVSNAFSGGTNRVVGYKIKDISDAILDNANDKQMLRKDDLDDSGDNVLRF